MLDIHGLTQKSSLIAADVRSASYKGPDVGVQDMIGRATCILSAEAQGSGISNTIKLQSSPAVEMGYGQFVVGTNDIPLRTGATDNVKLAAAFTQDGGRQVKTVTLMLKRKGTIASGKKIFITLEADSSGAPSGTALGTSASVDPAAIGASSYEPVTFTFAEPVDLTDDAKYHIVLQGDYDASGDNQILWRAATVSSGGNSATYDSAWSATATLDLEAYVMQFNFSDLSGAAFTAVGNAASFQTIPVKIDGAGPYIRAVSTVAGGSSTGAAACCIVGRLQVA
jgi:hypothetical protein